MKIFDRLQALFQGRRNANSDKAFDMNTWKLLSFGSNDNPIYRVKLDVQGHPTLNALFEKIATDMSRMSITHLKKGNSVKEGSLNDFFKGYINPVENVNTFLQKITYRLLIDSNVFIIIGRDKKNSKKINELIILDYNSTTVFRDSKDKYYLKSQLDNGKSYVVPYENVIHLKKWYNEGIMGKPMLESLKDQLSLLQTHDVVIKKLLENSNSLRGIVRLTGNINKDKTKRMREQFVKDTFNNDTGHPIAVIDSGVDYIDLSKQTGISTISLTDKQSELLEKRVYSFFNVSPKVVNGTATQDEYNHYLETVIKPIAEQLTIEFSLKLLSDKERKKGEKILFNPVELLSGSIRDKAQFYKVALEAGIYTINEAREHFNLKPVEEGDKPRVSLNFVELAEATNYQLTQGDNRLRQNDNKEGGGNSPPDKNEEVKDENGNKETSTKDNS